MDSRISPVQRGGTPGEGESSDVPVEAPIVARIRGLLPSLTEAEQRVGQRVLSDPTAAASLTIGQLADHSQTSLTTVTRFCRALGLRGYAELRLGLATDIGRAQGQVWATSLGADIQPADPLHRVLESLVAADTTALRETAAQLDMETLERAVADLASARRIALYAVSGSGTVAHEAQLRLCRIGRDASLWTDVHDALTSAALLTRSDVALGISHSGETTEVIEALTEARRHGARTIAITNFPRSSVVDAADLVLTTAARDTTFRSGGPSARAAQMLVVDCLYVGVAQRTHATARAALAATAEAVRTHRLPTGKRR